MGYSDSLNEKSVSCALKSSIRELLMTYTLHGWTLPPDGALAAVSSNEESTLSSTGVGKNPRIDFLCLTACETFISPPNRKWGGSFSYPPIIYIFKFLVEFKPFSSHRNPTVHRGWASVKCAIRSFCCASTSERECHCLHLC